MAVRGHEYYGMQGKMFDRTNSEQQVFMNNIKFAMMHGDLGFVNILYQIDFSTNAMMTYTLHSDDYNPHRHV
jgi:hypothetical protein